MRWRIHLDAQPYMIGERLFMAKESERGLAVARPVELALIVDHGAPVQTDQAFMRDRYPGECRTFLQAMLDAGYALGLRPTEAPNAEREQAGELRAMTAHLEDMRRLAGLGRPAGKGRRHV